MTAPVTSTSHDRLISDSRRLRSLAIALLGCPHAADDAVQEVWTRVLVRDPGATELHAGWLRGVVRNVAREMRRSRRRRLARETVAYAMHARDKCIDRGAADVAARLEAHEVLVRSVRSLPEPIRTAIARRYFDGWTAARIARFYDVPAATIRWRLQRGLVLLRNDLDESHGTAGSTALLTSLATKLAPWVALGKGVLIVSATSWKILIAAAVAALIALVLWDLAETESVSVHRSNAEEGAPTLAATSERTEMRSPHTLDVAVDDVAATEKARVRVTGVVLNVRGVPVPNAQVRVSWQSHKGVTTSTNSEGRYELVVDPGSESRSMLAVVEATHSGHGSGHVCARLEPTRSRREAVEPIRLQAHARLSIHVSGEGTPVKDALVLLVRTAQHRGSPAWTELARGMSRANGEWTSPDPVAGSVAIHVAAKGFGRTTLATFVDARQDTPIEIALGEERVARVQVLDIATGNPIPGADIGIANYADNIKHPLLPQLRPVITDHEGYATIDQLPLDRALYLHPTIDGYAGPVTDLKKNMIHVLAPYQTDRTVWMQPVGTLAIPIKPGPYVPPVGTKLAIVSRSTIPGQEATVTQDGVQITGTRIKPGWAPVAESFHGTLVAPDQSWSRIDVSFGHGADKPIEFFPDRTFTVEVTHADGSPAAKLPLQFSKRAPGFAPVVTDGAGRANVSHCMPVVGELRTRAPEPYVYGRANSVLLGDYNPLADDGVQRYVLPTIQTLSVQLTCGGKPLIPHPFRVRLDGTIIHWSQIEQDVDTGMLRIQHPRTTNDAVLFEIGGYGIQDAKKRLVIGAAATHTLELTRACRLVCHVQPPADGSYVLGIERWNAAKRQWERVPRPMELDSSAKDRQMLAGEHEWRFMRLAPGRYRVIDYHSRLTSDAIEFQQGDDPIQVELNLSRATWVRCKVTAPPSFTLEGIQLQAYRGDTLLRGRYNMERTSYSAPTYRVRGVIGVPLRLIVKHPTLRMLQPKV